MEKKEQRIKAKHDKSANEVEPKRIKLWKFKASFKIEKYFWSKINVISA